MSPHHTPSGWTLLLAELTAAGIGGHATVGTVDFSGLRLERFG